MYMYIKLSKEHYTVCVLCVRQDTALLLAGLSLRAILCYTCYSFKMLVGLLILQDGEIAFY